MLCGALGLWCFRLVAVRRPRVFVGSLAAWLLWLGWQAPPGRGMEEREHSTNDVCGLNPPIISRFLLRAFGVASGGGRRERKRASETHVDVCVQSQTPNSPAPSLQESGVRPIHVVRVWTVWTFGEVDPSRFLFRGGRFPPDEGKPSSFSTGGFLTVLSPCHAKPPRRHWQTGRKPPPPGVLQGRPQGPRGGAPPRGGSHRGSTRPALARGTANLPAKLTLLRFVDSTFLGDSLWTWEFHPSILRFCLSQTL